METRDYHHVLFFGLQMQKTPRDTFDSVKLLAYIASQGHYPALKFVDRKLGPFSKEDYNTALLNAAIYKGDIEVFEYLTCKGADELVSPLIHVSRRGKLNLVMFLVERLKSERITHHDFNIGNSLVKSPRESKSSQCISTLSEDELFSDSNELRQSTTKSQLFDQVDVFTEAKNSDDVPPANNVETLDEARRTNTINRIDSIDGADEAIIFAAAMGRQDVVAYLSRYVEPHTIQKVEGLLNRTSKGKLHRSSKNIEHTRFAGRSNEMTSPTGRRTSTSTDKGCSNGTQEPSFTRGRSSSVV